MINRIEKFRFWCHKILPLVYDDSLSYYEFLCKLNAKLIEVIDTVNDQNEVIDGLDAKLDEALEELFAVFHEWETAHATTVQMVQTLGDDETKVISQKGVTDAIMALHDNSIICRGEVTNEAVAGGDITFNLNDTNFFNSIWYCGTDFTTNPNAQHLPILTQGVVTTKCPIPLDSLGSTAKVHCVEQTYMTDILTEPCMYIRYANWTGSAWTWSDWAVVTTS